MALPIPQFQFVVARSSLPSLMFPLLFVIIAQGLRGSHPIPIHIPFLRSFGRTPFHSSYCQPSPSPPFQSNHNIPSSKFFAISPPFQGYRLPTEAATNDEFGDDDWKGEEGRGHQIRKSKEGQRTSTPLAILLQKFDERNGKEREGGHGRIEKTEKLWAKHYVECKKLIYFLLTCKIF